ncbi:Asp-tRNA(Asn)/Glu-tRNA(Gln) amidotransferase A subunit family amidase [Azospirillum brasilense]|nr:Asp-tRNA(Asn)/Glu-tRNA(Gln) amidotransferase A subunit family amidase [Azospirillum brasilense]
MEPFELTASEAARAIRDGRLTSEALVRSCLERIEARDPEVRAWITVDPALALAAAREADKRPAAGPLHGLPFGVKDVIDTADLPTTQNSPIFQGHRPARDAACVSIARSAGGILLGKTDTVEFASGGRKAATRNPVNPAHTPGGSSSGSGAAVGDRHVPLAFGTQTGGSHIRPAAFNGIYGFKPTWGVVSREGMKHYAVSLDTLGWYGRSVADLALMAEAFQLDGMGATPPVTLAGLRVGLCRSPVWSHIEPAGEAALLLAARRLEEAGAVVVPFELPDEFSTLAEVQDVIRRGEGRASFLNLYISDRHRLHPELADHCEHNRGITPRTLAEAYDVADSCRPRFAALFESIDVILTPPAPGEAPEGLHTTGDHIFNSIWTVLHVPCLAMPCGHGPRGLPVGVQLVAPRFQDAALLAMAEAMAPVVDI